MRATQDAEKTAGDPPAANADIILSQVSHRPWPLPDLPWIMVQQWTDLLFAHWALPPEIVRPLVPPELDLDLYDGKAWVAVTPFRMTEIRMRGLPPIPGASKFLEMNLRTYVRQRPADLDADGIEKPGVYFFSLDASNLPAVLGARIGLGLPYFWSDMTADVREEKVHYVSQRRESPEHVDVTYWPGEAITRPTELELFLAERYCLYEVRMGKAIRTQIQHWPWSLRVGHARFAANTLGARRGLPLTLHPDLLHFSKQLDVLIYAPG